MTFTFASLGITNANQRALIVNLARPGSENPPSVTTALSPLVTSANLANAVTLNVCSASGALWSSTPRLPVRRSTNSREVSADLALFSGLHRPSRLS